MDSCFGTFCDDVNHDSVIYDDWENGPYNVNFFTKKEKIDINRLEYVFISIHNIKVSNHVSSEKF